MSLTKDICGPSFAIVLLLAPIFVHFVNFSHFSHFVPVLSC